MLSTRHREGVKRSTVCTGCYRPRLLELSAGSRQARRPPDDLMGLFRQRDRNAVFTDLPAQGVDGPLYGTERRSKR
jgi:hypothetical protein